MTLEDYSVNIYLLLSVTSSGDFYLDQFYVQVRRPGVVALQSAKNSRCFLCIKKGIASANVSVVCRVGR